MRKTLVAVISLCLCAPLVSCKKDEKKEPQAKPADTGKPTATKPETKPPETKPTQPTETKPAAKVETQPFDAESIFELPIKTLTGEDSKVGDHKGKALLIVNVASKCGLTPQYETLEKLQKKYADKGFTVLGFPCNQFGGQEPGTHEEIGEFCSKTYGVTFPMFEKVEVNGSNRHPIYKELTKIKDGKGHGGDIRWNFEKFVISADGKSIVRFEPKTKPDSPEMIAAIEAGLPAAN